MSNVEAKTTANQPAFPTVESINHHGVIETKTDFPGMTLRQYYAGLAMQGIMANSALVKPNPDVIARDSIKAADALIEALNKTINND